MVKKEVKHKVSKKPEPLKSEKEIAMDFAMSAHKKFDRVIKASILFGSQAKNTAGPGSDIDIILIVDDAAINWDMELVAWYREELSKLVANNAYEKELHINTIKLTTWWEDLLQGDPVVINILRYGEGLIDVGGFFNPLKALLTQGKIHSTPEAVYAALQRAPMHLARSKSAEMGAIEGVYWTIIDSSQAALIAAGKLPPSPEHIPEYLYQTFVENKVLKTEYVNMVREIYILHKSISHGTISNIKGAEIDLWQQKAEQFLLEMTHIIDTLIDSKKN